MLPPKASSVVQYPNVEVQDALDAWALFERLADVKMDYRRS